MVHFRRHCGFVIALSRYMSAVAGTVPFTVLSAHRHTLTASAKLALVHITHLVRWLRNWVSMKIALKRIKTWFSDCLQRKSNFLFWHGPFSQEELISGSYALHCGLCQMHFKATHKNQMKKLEKG